MGRGTLDSGHSNLNPTTFAQCWTLDETGNWSDFRQDDNGDGTWNLIQSRTANKVNEITDITESTGPSWATPAYSKAGNMTTMPQPASPTNSFVCTYDAWNRMVKVKDGPDNVSESQYDAAHRRIISRPYTGGVLDEIQHLYYTEPTRWQVIEERIDTSTNPHEQHVYGERYVDDILLRDRDTNGDGTLDERLYGMQDANWNVSGLISPGGVVQQRMTYTGYGGELYLTSSFDSSTNTKDWTVSYSGYKKDLTTAILFVRHRIFVSNLGAWTQRDPLGLLPGYNLYAYANLRPLTTRDPYGLLPPIDVTPWFPYPSPPNKFSELCSCIENCPSCEAVPGDPTRAVHGCIVAKYVGDEAKDRTDRLFPHDKGLTRG